MGKERVESKNLFNFKPQGHLDEDIEAFYEKGKAGLTNNSLAAWSDSMKKMSEEEFVGMMRGMMDKNIATSSMVTDPALVEVRWTSSAIIQSSLMCLREGLLQKLMITTMMCVIIVIIILVLLMILVLKMTKKYQIT